MMMGWRLALLAGLALVLLATGCERAERLNRQPMTEVTTRPGPVSPEPPGASARRGPDRLFVPPATQPPLAEFYSPAGRARDRVTTPVFDAGSAAEGGITLNYANAEIRSVVQAVLGDLLGLNYALDPSVQGQITLETNRPIAREAVLDVLQDVLRTQGVELSRSGSVITVAPIGGSGVAPGEPSLSLLPGDGLQVVSLSYIGPERMVELLRSLSNRRLSARAIPGRPMLIVGGNDREIASALDLIALFDVSAMAGQHFALFNPRHSSADALAEELSLVFESAGEVGASPVRFTPLQRLNAVLAIAPGLAPLREASRWVARLDRPGPGVARRVFVYSVQHGRATDLAAVLNNLYASGSGGLGRSSAGPTVSAPTSRRSNGGSDASSGLSSVALRADPRPDEEPESVGVVMANPRWSEDEPAPQITADDRNNALIVLASPQQYEELEAVIEKLDVAPLQVLIEAVVAEVTLTDDLRYGVQWFLRSGNFSTAFSSQSSGEVVSQFPGFSSLFAGSDIRATLNALEQVTEVKVISSPRMMVVNNETATLQVGDEVPIATQSSVSTLAADAPVVNTIQFRDTGVILEVTPRVNESGTVRLDITQEISDVTETTTSDIDSPTIQQRKFTSSVSVSNGETIALGGLIRDRRSDGQSGIPLLMDVPVLGSLFSTTSEVGTRTEIVVLITPRVVRSLEEIRLVTDELKARFSETLPALR